MSHFKPHPESHLRKFPVPQPRLLVQSVLLSLALLAGESALSQVGVEQSPATPLAGDLVQVNVNEADAATIADILVGIGLSRAQAIVDYREEHGEFTSLEQLVDVKGIGEATIFNNKDRIRFE